ncbi:hypothetical protein LCGC14_1379640 [marine sediment metagenome]|uniref:HMA domain-containing protein n=1 Tax=marine sediment metagenome TaxID=412755 RepID=A0A0F9K3F3_9ZZZZ
MRYEFTGTRLDCVSLELALGLNKGDIQSITTVGDKVTLETKSSLTAKAIADMESILAKSKS